MPELTKKPSRFLKFTNKLFDPGDLSDKNIRRNRDMADILLNQASNPNVQSPTQGLASLAQALNAQIFRQRANRGETALKEQKTKQLGDFLSGLNLNPDQQSVLQNAPEGIRDQLLGGVAAQQFEPPKQPKIGQTQIREGNEFVTRRTINGQIDTSDEGVLARSKIDRRQQIEQGPPGSFDSQFETAGNRDEEIKRQRSVLGITGEISESLKNVQANPRSTGAIGSGSEFANQFGDVPIVGGAITAATEQLTGLDPRKLSEIRTQGQATVAKLVPVITGDDSGRYTDREQQRTEEIQKQSQFWTTAPQVVGGLSELMSIQIRGEIRTKGPDGLTLFAGQPLDLSTDDGINQWGAILVEQYGLPEDKAVEEIQKHIELLR